MNKDAKNTKAALQLENQLEMMEKERNNVKAVARELVEFCAKTGTSLQLLVCELQSQLDNDRYLELVATKKEEQEEIVRQERRANWMARKERCFDRFGNEL